MSNATSSKKSDTEAINKVKNLYLSSYISITKQFKKVSQHIDKIRINCNSKNSNKIDEDKFFSSMQGLGFNSRVRNLSIRDIAYKWIWKYKNSITNEKIDILHCRSLLEGVFRPQIQMHFNDPTKETLQRLIELCSSLNIQIKFAQIEYAMDYLYDMYLHQFFIDHLFVNNNRGIPTLEGKKGDNPINDWIIMTYYSGQKNKKGAKSKNCKITTLYRKEKDGREILRLEVILNREKNRQFKLEQLENINTLDISKMFCFKDVNWKKVDKHIENKFLKHRGLDKRWIPMCVGLKCDAMLNRLHEPGVMARYSHFKKEKLLSQPGRFFVKMPKINKEFFAALKNKPFLK